MREHREFAGHSQCNNQCKCHSKEYNRCTYLYQSPQNHCQKDLSNLFLSKYSHKFMTKYCIWQHHHSSIHRERGCLIVLYLFCSIHRKFDMHKHIHLPQYETLCELKIIMQPPRNRVHHHFLYVLAQVLQIHSMAHSLLCQQSLHDIRHHPKKNHCLVSL